MRPLTHGDQSEHRWTRSVLISRFQARKFLGSNHLRSKSLSRLGFNTWRKRWRKFRKAFFRWARTFVFTAGIKETSFLAALTWLQMTWPHPKRKVLRVVKSKECHWAKVFHQTLAGGFNSTRMPKHHGIRWQKFSAGAKSTQALGSLNLKEEGPCVSCRDSFRPFNWAVLYIPKDIIQKQW